MPIGHGQGDHIPLVQGHLLVQTVDAAVLPGHLGQAAQVEPAMFERDLRQVGAGGAAVAAQVDIALLVPTVV